MFSFSWWGLTGGFSLVFLWFTTGLIVSPVSFFFFSRKVIGGELQERLIPVPYSKTTTDQAVRFCSVSAKHSIDIFSSFWKSVCIVVQFREWLQQLQASCFIFIHASFKYIIFIYQNVLLLYSVYIILERC